MFTFDYYPYEDYLEEYGLGGICFRELGVIRPAAEFVYNSYDEFKEDFLRTFENKPLPKVQPPIPSQGILFLYLDRAAGLVDKYTFGRYTESGNMKLGYELAEFLYLNSKNPGAVGIASESIGKWSRTYASSEDMEKSFNKKVKSIIRKHVPAEYFYRGVDENK
jgi:hypothetical protein